MVLIEYKDVECVDLTYAAMPPAYRQQESASPNPNPNPNPNPQP